MTIPELQALAQKSLETGIELIRKSGSLMQMIHLVKRDGSMEIMAFAGEISNSKSAKYAIGRRIKERIKTVGDIEAVIMLSDIYFTSTLTEEQEQVRRVFGWNVEESAAAGLCEKHEAVMVSLESPIYTQLMRQEYERHGDGADIRLVGEPVTVDDTKGATYTGNLAGFFRDESLVQGAGQRAAGGKQ